MSLRPAMPAWPRLSPIAAGESSVRVAPAARGPERMARDLWWLHPLTWVALMVLVYVSFMAFDFTRVVPRAYIPGSHYAWGAALLLALAVGIGSATVGRTPPPSAGQAIDFPRWATAGLLAATVFAYALWFWPMVVNPQLFLDILNGTRSNLRDTVSTQPGVTTMTQFGVAYAVACAAIGAGRARPLEPWERLGLGLLVVLAAVRALAWSERLAVIELVLPYGVARLAFTRIRGHRAWRLAGALPLLAPLLVYLLFTATEYFRSWDFYRDQYRSIWVFSLERLLTYYATASNNGIGLLAESADWPAYSGRFVAEWLYLMPGLGEALRASIGDVQTQYFYFLERFARPEFNNASGLFPIVFDIGYAGSLLYFVAAGAVVGALWDGWRRRAPAGVLLYPTAVIFLVELLRFNYFASTRFFAAAIALLFLWAVARPQSASLQGSRW
jgi:hypothetical protein